MTATHILVTFPASFPSESIALIQDLLHLVDGVNDTYRVGGSESKSIEIVADDAQFLDDLEILAPYLVTVNNVEK